MHQNPQDTFISTMPIKLLLFKGGVFVVYCHLVAMLQIARPHSSGTLKGMAMLGRMSLWFNFNLTSKQ